MNTEEYLIKRREEMRDCALRAHENGCNEDYEEINDRMKEINSLLSMKIIQHKPIVQCDLQGNELKVYPSAMSAARAGFTRADISQCCRGKRKTHKGFTWKFKQRI